VRAYGHLESVVVSNMSNHCRTMDQDHLHLLIKPLRGVQNTEEYNRWIEESSPSRGIVLYLKPLLNVD